MADEQKPKTQKTQKGLEIPVPSKTGFLAALKKVSKPLK